MLRVIWTDKNQKCIIIYFVQKGYSVAVRCDMNHNILLQINEKLFKITKDLVFRGLPHFNEFIFFYKTFNSHVIVAPHYNLEHTLLLTLSISNEAVQVASN